MQTTIDRILHHLAVRPPFCHDRHPDSAEQHSRDDAAERASELLDRYKAHLALRSNPRL
jgi:hypothetical protein